MEHAARISRMQLAALAGQHPELGGRKNIPVSLADKITLVPVENVISFQADQKYVRMAHIESGDVQGLSVHHSLIEDSLKALAEEFADDFIRIHRNSLVRTGMIESLVRDDAGQYAVLVRCSGEVLPVSRRNVAALKELLRQPA